jgi:hypothetical protein
VNVSEAERARRKESVRRVAEAQAAIQRQADEMKAETLVTWYRAEAFLRTPAGLYAGHLGECQALADGTACDCGKELSEKML